VRSLDGQRVPVTGASSGIGALVAMMLVFRGCHVVGSGRSWASPAGSAASQVMDLSIARDLTEAGAAADLVAQAAAKLGGLDVVISNAGAGWAGPYESMTAAELDWALELNLRVPMRLAHAAAAHLRRARGQLVLVGSVTGKLGVAEEAAYSTAKAGLNGLADSLRSEWGPEVAVSLVSPGAVATPFFERRNRPYARHWPPPIPAARAARAVVKAVEHRRAELYVPYWIGWVSLLHGSLPGIYRYLASIAEGTAPTA